MRLFGRLIIIGVLVFVVVVLYRRLEHERQWQPANAQLLNMLPSEVRQPLLGALSHSPSWMQSAFGVAQQEDGLAEQLASPSASANGNVLGKSTASPSVKPVNQLKQIGEKTVEYARYLYCQQVIEGWEKTHQ
jgi:hypothetical protein